MDMKKTLKTMIKVLVKDTFIYKRFIQKKEAYNKYFCGAYSRLEVIEQTKKRFCYNNKNKTKQYKILLRKIYIQINPGKRFQHWIDTGYYFCNFYTLPDALPPNYELIINSSLYEIIKENKGKKNLVELNNYNLLVAITRYIQRIIKLINKKNKKLLDENLEKTKIYFENMLSTPAKTLEEGLQRILFWSSLFWQTGFKLIGLGRLDKLLANLDSPSNNEELISLVVDFYNELHNYYAIKSNVLMGDTGQVIILGGTEIDGSYYCNKLTYIFIDSLIKIRSPDPKLLLRCASNMPDALLEKALFCNSLGIGCPLLSNDDIVIPSLEKFGYTHGDACNYATSACWEPLNYGKGLGRGNLGDINYAQVLVDTYEDNNFVISRKFSELENLYIEKLKEHVLNKIAVLNGIKWEKAPLLSLFTEGCRLSGKDISEGGAINNDYGISTVGLANAINSLLSINDVVFVKKVFTMQELKDSVEHDYQDNLKLKTILSENDYFGHDDKIVLDLVNTLTTVVSDLCSSYKNPFGGNLKFGFSSPNYINCGLKTLATLDGRNAYAPLAVHLSARLGTAYTELLSFASQLQYQENRANGNVVDLFISPNIIHSSFDKFMQLIKTAIEIGFFQIQMNVVSSKTLIEAKNDPSLYPDLIVRVWGFSAYFNDLPEDYKELLIQRALESEMSA
ncbi:pyruvate formate lyase family protein [Treponema brennaborense]|uniref:Formate C-acetyltransferase n=1 Tax=Treponema brennaborense (strain DSM 12168 / CIP 105900 / DD5/3) TaxID=906968 RepID=F4LMG8_TREBD|nr:pyruvate formate lyase family protein [Treponema brennaborense]AEE15730.1 Formate C-acetyltransferase [Treponema brennaborense DSM 12168]